MSLPQDILGVIRGLQAVAKAGLKLQETSLKVIWQNSSVKFLTEEYVTNVRKSSTTKVNKDTAGFVKNISESGEKFCSVVDGVKQYVAFSTRAVVKETAAKASVEKTNQPAKPPPSGVKSSDLEIKLTASDKELLKKLDMEHREKLKAAASKDVTEKTLIEKKPEAPPRKKSVREEDTKIKADNVQQKEKAAHKTKVKAVPNPKSKQSFS